MTEGVNVKLFQNQRSPFWQMRWVDPHTKRDRFRSTKTEIHGEAKVICKQTESEINNSSSAENRLRLEALNMNNEEKIRKYIQIKNEESEKAKDRMATKQKSGESGAIAAAKLGISRDSGRKGEAVLKAADKLKENGNTEESDRLIKRLNESISGAFGEIEIGKASRSKAIDSNICTRIYGLARKIDERLELRGGEQYRDSCMDVLKQLSAKHDEWRASE